MWTPQLPLQRLFRTSLLTSLIVTAASSADAAPPPQVRVPRIDAAPRIENFASQAARSEGLAPRMTRVDGWIQRAPRDGEALSEKTEGYFGYDDEALHVVVVCHDREPHRVSAHLSPRDLIPAGDDTIALQLDTFRDLTHAYGFQVNALGVQQDGTYTEGKGWDLSWDTVWSADGRVTEEGYVVIVSVPFRSLRFPPRAAQDGTITFGVMIFRGIPRTSESGFWPEYSAKLQGKMNQAALLEGMQPAGGGKKWQVAPYLNARSFRTLESTTPRTYRKDPFDGTLGADGKLVVRDSLSLDLTANPDFSQVESDEPQVTVNQRFEVFFPEKRPFFLENSAFFDTPIPLFFSRRIQDPDFGARVSGRAGRNAIGALFARDAGTSRANTAVLRLSRDVADQSTIGFFASGRNPSGSTVGRNFVGGIDSRLRLPGTWSALLQGAMSSTTRSSGQSQDGFAAKATVQRTGTAFNVTANYSERTDHFESALGFIDRVSIRSFDENANHRWFPKNSLIQSFGPDLATSLVTDRKGRTLDSLAQPGFTLTMSRFTSVSAYAQFGNIRLRASEFDFGDSHREFSEAFSQDGWGWSAVSSPSNLVNLSAAGSSTRGINLVPAAGRPASAAKQNYLNASVDFHPSARLGLTITGLETRLRDSDGGAVFTNRILRAKTQFQFSRELSARFILQYDTLAARTSRTFLEAHRSLNVDFLLTYLLHPGTAIYAGFNNNLVDLDARFATSRSGLARPSGSFLSDGRQFFVKASYLVR